MGVVPPFGPSAGAQASLRSPHGDRPGRARPLRRRRVCRSPSPRISPARAAWTMHGRRQPGWRRCCLVRRRRPRSRRRRCGVWMLLAGNPTRELYPVRDRAAARRHRAGQAEPYHGARPGAAATVRPPPAAEIVTPIDTMPMCPSAIRRGSTSGVKPIPSSETSSRRPPRSAVDLGRSALGHRGGARHPAAGVTGAGHAAAGAAGRPPGSRRVWCGGAPRCMICRVAFALCNGWGASCDGSPESRRGHG